MTRVTQMTQIHTGASSMQVFRPSNTPWLLLKDDRSISKKVRVVPFFQTADSACEFLIFLSILILEFTVSSFAPCIVHGNKKVNVKLSVSVCV